MDDLELHMQKTLEALKGELATIRTGRATPALVENIMIEVYGMKMRLMEVATILAPDAHLITIQPWDTGNLTPIRKGIEEANIGLNPQIDATNIIRIAIPMLTEERRKEFVKRVKGIVEEFKVRLRMSRQDAVKEVEKLEKAKEISEDDAKREKEKIQKLVDSYVAKIDDFGNAKEADLMKV
jgi:ribosome recycling factor